MSDLIEGVSKAYATQNPEQTSYFSINVSILKGKTGGGSLSSVLMIVFTILIIIAGLFAVIAAVKKRKEQKVLLESNRIFLKLMKNSKKIQLSKVY